MPSGVYERTEEHKRNIKNNPNYGMKGKKLSEEAKRKIGKALEGNQNAKGNQCAKGRKHTEEAKRKIGKGNKGNQHTKGYKHTEEAKRKIGKASEARRGENKKGDDVTDSAWGYRARRLYESRHDKIPKGHILHHEDENRTNNSDDNHRLFPSQSEHIRYHALVRRNENSLENSLV